MKPLAVDKACLMILATELPLVYILVLHQEHSWLHIRGCTEYSFKWRDLPSCYVSVNAEGNIELLLQPCLKLPHQGTLHMLLMFWRKEMT